MLKLPKGLKKKKKSKKNKELFTEEELEQYKLQQKAKQEAELEQQQEHHQPQQQQQYQAQAAQQPIASSSRVSKQQSEDDEWSKFKQLTTGIDTVLKKTQVNLDRIKEESFFQRITPKQPEPEPEAAEDEPPQPQLSEEELIAQRKLEALKAAVVELSESEDEDYEDADDIFNTNYTEEIESGALPLAYVPESPDEEDLGPDPFDTGYADKVIKGPEVSKRGKKIVNIGSAVQVLTGRVENVAIDKKALRRPRRGPQNLLLESFDLDPEDTDQTDHPVEEAKPVLTLLDDTSDIFVDAPIDLTASLHLDFLKKQREEEEEAERKRKELAALERDEFDELAAESLTKKDEVIVLDSSVVIGAQLVEEQNWSEFTKEAELGIVHVDDLDFEVDDADPFDTGYVQSVVREKSIDDDDFDPRAGEEPAVQPKALPQESLTVVRKDLLSGSTSDLTDLSHIPVIAASESIELEIDPFDTSAVISLVQPKETEIKFLEKELLTGIKPSLSDPDFDPRADDESVLQANANLLAERKSSLSLNITSAHKAVVFNVGGDEAFDDGSSDSKRKPVTPYYPRKSIEEAGDISDSEFDPRAATPGQAVRADLLGASGSEINTKVLTPATSSAQIEEGTYKFGVLPCTGVLIHFYFITC